MRKVVGLYILFIFFASESALSQVDSCLLFWPNTSSTQTDSLGWNWDSVMYNKCNGGNYAKNYFEVTFLYYILSDSIGKSGTPEGRNWRDIDSKYSETRDGFAKIEQLYGTFTLLRMPGMPLDTSKYYSKQWYVNFDNFVNIDSVVNFLSRIPQIDTITGLPANFYGGIIWYADVNKELSQNNIQLWPQPCHSILFIQGDKPFTKITTLVYDVLGRQVNIQSEFISDHLMTMNLSSLREPEYFISVSDHVYKIIFQK